MYIRQYIFIFFISGNLFLKLTKNGLGFLVFIMLFANFQLKAQNDNYNLTSFQSINIDSVSVLENGNVIIGWTFYTDVTAGYVEVHRRLDSGTYGVISRVTMPQTFFIDNVINTQTNSFSYYVVAYDINDNVIGFSDNPAHQTIFVHDIVPNICGKQITIEWQKYTMSTTVGNPQPLPTPFDQQQIWLSYNDQDLELIGFTDSLSENFTFNADQSGNYCFSVRAMQSGNEITTSSNVKCMDIYFPLQPEFAYIRSVSVNPDNNQMEILAHVDNRIPKPSYVLEKFNKELDDFAEIDSVSNEASSISLIDFDARFDSQTENYRLVAIDSCGNRSAISQTANSVFLTAIAVSSQINYLEWTPYTGWETGVFQYSVERLLDNATGWEFLADLNGNENSYEDNLNLLPDDVISRPISYRIMATENVGNTFGFLDQAFSNQTTVVREIEIFIPNAFKPSSQIPENRVFKPIFSFFVPEYYSMTIFNRWTDTVFSTTNIDEAWDGSAHGNEALPGVYSYVISYEDETGTKIEKRGTLLLIR